MWWAGTGSNRRPCGFQPVRLVRLCPARFACVALALVRRGLNELVVQDDTESCDSVRIGWAEPWQNRAHARWTQAHSRSRGSGAPCCGPWLARETPPAAPGQAARLATVLFGGALAGSGPGTSPCIDGLSLVSGVVVPQRLTSSNCAHEDGRPGGSSRGRPMQASPNRPLACKARSDRFVTLGNDDPCRSQRPWHCPWLSARD